MLAWSDSPCDWLPECKLCLFSILVYIPWQQNSDTEQELSGLIHWIGAGVWCNWKHQISVPWLMCCMCRKIHASTPALLCHFCTCVYNWGSKFQLASLISRRRNWFHFLICLHSTHVTFPYLSCPQSFGKGGSWLVFYSEGNNCAEARASNPDSSKTLPISWLVLAAGHTQLQGWRSFQIVEKLLCAKAYWKYRKTSQYG